MTDANLIVSPPELDWLEKHLVELQARYPNQWVAVGPNGFIEASPFIRYVVSAARDQGVNKPLVVFIDQNELK